MAENNNKPLPQATISEEMLARKPRQPTAAECCGDGCAVCVYDIYAQELTIWENECKRELQYGYGRRELQQGSVISPDHYKLFVLQKIRKMTECCSKYTFAINDFGSIGYGIGQHLIMRASVDGEIVTRKMSKYIRTLKEGCSVEWRGPLGRLDYKPNMHKHILMLAAGTGIAPHGASVAAHYNILYCLSDEAKVQDIKYGDEVHCGEIDEELLEAELTKRSIPHVLLCGPSAFNNRFVKYLKSRTDPVTWHVF
ncbi:hypothetical protein MRX96_009226 [Rhipicephalus microplus]